MSIKSTTSVFKLLNSTIYGGVQNSSISINGSTTIAYPQGSSPNYNFTFTTPLIYPAPYPFTSPPFYAPAVVVNSNDFYTYSFYYYLILLALLVLAAVFAKIAMRRRQEIARAAVLRARQERQRNATVSTISTGPNNAAAGDDNNNNSAPTDSDLPPAYDDVMQTYINAKLQLQSREEGAVGGLTTAISSVTIETEVDAVTSVSDLTVVATSHPPTYENTCSNNNKQNNSDNSIV